jgi:RecB family exonuclease
MPTVIDAIAELADEFAPAPVIVIAPTASLARWTARLLADRGAVVGVRCFDVERLITEILADLGVPRTTDDAIFHRVGRALAGSDEFTLVHDQTSYRRAVAELFTELDRCSEPDLTACATSSNPRDQALLAAFGRFRALREQERLEHAATDPSSSAPATAVSPIDAGEALAVALRRRLEVPWIRDAATTVAIGFGPERPRWTDVLLDAFEARHLARPPVPTPAEIDRRVVADGPEAEIAFVARALRSNADRACVLVPADEVPRWVERLHHRDVPVRAWTSSSAAQTASAATVRALLRCATGGRIARRDVHAVLFGAAFAPFAALQGEGGYASRAALETLFRRQRRISGHLFEFIGRVRDERETELAAVRERATESEWTTEDTQRRLETIQHSHGVLIAALERISSLRTGGDVRRLLDDWRAMARARAHREPALEIEAVRRIFEVLDRLEDHPLVDCESAIASALERASAGAWVDDAGDGMNPVWVLPYDATLDDRPPTVFACGLDRHPPAPEPGFLLSPTARALAGLLTPLQRHADAIARLDAIAAEGGMTASRRNRDGTGSRCPPGPWIARRTPPNLRGAGGEAGGHESEIRAPLSAIAIPDDPVAYTRLEARIFAPGAEVAGAESALELERRVAAVVSHEQTSVGPHTGDLGVIVPPPRPYSASSLQTYARLPYEYFVGRVLGIDESEELGDALSALEHGTLVHAAMERAFAARLSHADRVDASDEQLRAEALVALQTEFTRHAEGSLAAAVWRGDVTRWTHELERWWDDFARRMRSDRGDRPGDQVVAVELSLGRGDRPHFIDLHGQTVPFVAKIDRLERDAERPGLIIVDYKSGYPAPRGIVERDLRAGLHLQLPLYAAAVDALVALPPVEDDDSASFIRGDDERTRTVRLEQFKRGGRRGGGRPRFEAPSFELDETVGEDEDGLAYSVRECALRFAAEFVRAIEAGRFPLVRRTPSRFKPRRRDEALRIIPDAGRPSGLPEPLQRVGTYARTQRAATPAAPARQTGDSGKPAEPQGGASE